MLQAWQAMPLKTWQQRTLLYSWRSRCVLKEWNLCTVFRKCTKVIQNHSGFLFAFLKSSPMIDASSSLTPPCSRQVVFFSLPVTSFCNIRGANCLFKISAVFYTTQWEYNSYWCYWMLVIWGMERGCGEETNCLLAEAGEKAGGLPLRSLH